MSFNHVKKSIILQLFTRAHIVEIVKYEGLFVAFQVNTSELNAQCVF